MIINNVNKKYIYIYISLFKDVFFPSPSSSSVDAGIVPQACPGVPYNLNSGPWHPHPMAQANYQPMWPIPQQMTYQGMWGMPQQMAYPPMWGMGQQYPFHAMWGMNPHCS